MKQHNCYSKIFIKGLDYLTKSYRIKDPNLHQRHSFIELLKLLGIKSALSTAYHPQMDGTTERVNQEIEAYLSIYCTSHPDEWITALHTMEFTNRRHANRQKTQFELMFGESPIAIPLSYENTKYPTIKDKMKMLTRIHEEVLAAHRSEERRVGKECSS